ncbi:helicase HerA-like domain-containing protein [Thalassotalea sp. PS06]|uniref:helicase HerA-like domain-containing protein n=1 Tax=Thalassotalea sp. PS06 TaxID=2594005 RepID=UPI001165921B|nr:helicase HerA-like domain-containing protein [Thalassotalea sp. PS06]QDO99907.1 DUF853 family protein [Thalassotalea sp. PS06]
MSEANLDKFKQLMVEGYSVDGPSMTIGAAKLADQVFADLPIHLSLSSLSRHGLITGATGTGKTKTIQVLAEQLSEQGVNVLLMDMKGDLSGLGMPGEANESINKRHQQIGLDFAAKPYPVSLLTLSSELGIQLKATVAEFGPDLLARILTLSDAQKGLLAMLFQYCDDKQYPVVDLDDLKKLLQYISNEGKEEFSSEYGRFSNASTGAILRKLIALEQQGADRCFAERSFAIEDLLSANSNAGLVSILRLADIQSKPMLFSTFMLQLLGEAYQWFPEVGEVDKPKLVIFIDEAHLIFSGQSPELASQLESMVKLIRSKGVGLFFVTQNATDISPGVLSQLGLKIQHAVRAFTAKDRKALKQSVENLPDSEFYDATDALTNLGVGEAIVTALDKKSVPTPLVTTLLRAPQSRMGVLTDTEVSTLVSQSPISDKYNEKLNRESAYEILNEKLANAAATAKQREDNKPATTKKSSSSASAIVKMLTSATFVRGVFGLLNKMISK